MTDKQIIDVSKCEYYNYGACAATRDLYGDSSCDCKDYDMQNCFYRQLKRKEQALDQIEEICNNISSNGLDEEVDKFDDILNIINKTKDNK